MFDRAMPSLLQDGSLFRDGEWGRVLRGLIKIGMPVVSAGLLLSGCSDPSGSTYAYKLRSPSGSKVASFKAIEVYGTNAIDDRSRTSLSLSYSILPIPLEPLEVGGPVFPLWEGDNDLYLAYTRGYPGDDARPHIVSSDGVTGLVEGFVRVHVIPYVNDPDRVKFRQDRALDGGRVRYKVGYRPISDPSTKGYCTLEATGNYFHIVDLNRIVKSTPNSTTPHYENAGGDTLFVAGPSVPAGVAASLSQAKIDEQEFGLVLPEQDVEFGSHMAHAGIAEATAKTPADVVLKHFRQTHYTVKLGFGFDRQRLSIEVSDPIPADIADKFENCLAGKY